MNLVGPDDPVLLEVQPEFTGDPLTLKPVVERMTELMADKSNPGVGMAAPQIGQRVRLFVLQLKGMRRYVCVNPVVSLAMGPKRMDFEGCLTKPGARFLVPRSEHIRASWTNLHGQRETAVMRGLLARAFQHELDHLNGVVIWAPRTAA